MSRTVVVVASAVLSVILSGYLGAADCGYSRHRSVSGRTSAITIDGFDDQYGSATICAYQQSADPNASAPLGCVWPTYNTDMYDSCGKHWYSFSITVTLLGDNKYWFKDGTGPEFTRVFLTRSGSNGGLYTATGDESFGPSDDSTCYRSRLLTNLSIAPFTYYNGTVPSDLNCLSSERSFANCPFTCNLPEGCDSQYGTTQNEFNQSGFRQNLDYQTTALTLFDHRGPTGASGAPSGDWSYQLESGTCAGGSYYGFVCDSDGECPGSYCYRYYTLLRKNDFIWDSLNIRRGETRRNTRIEAWGKMKYVDYYHREIGVIGRYYDVNNYLAFVVTEYGGDFAKIHQYNNGTYAPLAWSWPSLNLQSWNRLAFEVRDNGSFANNGGFVPNGYCFMRGLVNDVQVVSNANQYCAFAPYGNYGVFSYYNMSPQFYDLDAYACTATGVCNR